MGRYLTDSGIKTSFLHIGDIANGTAETIEKAILQYLHGKALQITKLRAFGSDGAAVMTGRVSGVATRLSNRCPNMIAVHCANHRLALAAAHASDSVPYLKNSSLFFKHCSISFKTALCVWPTYMLSKRFSMTQLLNVNRQKMSVGCHMTMQLKL